MRFLDTRGLGEARYDPQEDLQQFADSTHIMLITVKAMDHATSDVVHPLQLIRASHPTRPIVLVLTCLHEAYPQQQHPLDSPPDIEQLPSDVPTGLRRSLAAHREAARRHRAEHGLEAQVGERSGFSSEQLDALRALGYIED